MFRIIAFALALVMVPSLQAAVKKVEVENVTIPVMIRRDFNPVMGLNIKVDKKEELLEFALDIKSKNPKEIKEIRVYKADIDKKSGLPVNNADPKTEMLGSIKNIRRGKSVLKLKKAMLSKGDNHLWISATVSAKASLEDFVELAITSVGTSSTKSKKISNAYCKQRIGYAITVPNFPVEIRAPKTGKVIEKRTSKYARIPGLTVTNKGTIIATFDARYRHNGDLPADIDVVISRSTDGGQTWSDVITCINARDLPGIGKGVGDPAILLDEKTNRVWIAGLAAPKTGHPIWKSETGTASPDRCGQLILAYSDDEGKTWSKPINITESVKRLDDSDTEKWALLFQGPGNGICMRDGTLVFPAQIWGHKGKGSHWGVLVYSKDNGKTWTSSKAMTFGGSESTVAELSDGSLMMNTREGAGGYRQVGVTKNLGKTWKKHSSVGSKRGGLYNPFCQGCLISVFNPHKGKSYNFGKSARHALFFSNPSAAKRIRHKMTVKVSKDNGRSWNTGVLYDQRRGMGYSAIYPIDKDYLGVFYESQGHYLQFLKIPFKEIFNAK